MMTMSEKAQRMFEALSKENRVTSLHRSNLFDEIIRLKDLGKINQVLEFFHDNPKKLDTKKALEIVKNLKQDIEKEWDDKSASHGSTFKIYLTPKELVATALACQKERLDIQTFIKKKALEGLKEVQNV